MTPFFGKRCFSTWVKKWVLLTVFLKSCVFRKHCFYSVFSKAQLFKNKTVWWKKTENLWKIVGSFWTWQKGVLGGLFFWDFNVIVVCFCVSAIVPKVLKMLVCFPVLGAFLGWLLLVYLCLEGLGVFVFLVFGFLFGGGFVSVCLLCFVLWLDVVVFISVCLCFLLFFVFFVLFFVFRFSLEGLRVRWGGPKGHLTWP